MGKRVRGWVRLFSIFSIGVFVLSGTKAEAFLDLNASLSVPKTLLVSKQRNKPVQISI